MNNVVSFINKTVEDEVATHNPPVIVRPDWDEVKEKIKLTETMSIPCKY